MVTRPRRTVPLAIAAMRSNSADARAPSRRSRPRMANLGRAPRDLHRLGVDLPGDPRRRHRRLAAAALRRRSIRRRRRDPVRLHGTAPWFLVTAVVAGGVARGRLRWT